MSWKIESPKVLVPSSGEVEVQVWITTPEGVLIELPAAAVRQTVVKTPSSDGSPCSQMTVGGMVLYMPTATGAELVAACKASEAAR